MKKFFTLLLTLALVVGIIPTFNVDVEAASSTLVVHYQRPDGDYADWNVWAWADSGDGKAFEFEYDDSFGKVAVIQLVGGAKQAGFIIRTDNWDKDVAEDRFVEFTDGVAEVWVTSGESDFDTTAPAGHEPFDLSGFDTGAGETPIVAQEGEKLVRIHYHRFDGNYEGWNLWLWPLGGEGDAYTFDKISDFGAVCETAIPNSADVSQIGFIVRLNEWEAKDVDADRFMDVTEVDEDGFINVYLVEADATIYYEEDQVDLSPKFLSCSLEGMDRVRVNVTVPFTLEGAKGIFTVRSGSGEEIAVKHVMGDAGALSSSNAIVILEENMVIGESYVLVSEEYGEISIDMSKMFSSPDFEDNYTYKGDDLGAVYSEASTTFKLWAPTASGVVLQLFKEGIGDDPYDKIPMNKGEQGVYELTVDGDLEGVFYLYDVIVGGVARFGVDPYAKAVAVNGDRAMVVNMDETNPEGWDSDQRPSFGEFTDAIVYELHVRDLSTHPSSGIENVGKYLGLTETGTTNEAGLSTGLDHMKELGITHVQLLPVFDYRSIDETSLDQNNFNWGYDPENYNVPEGSYSADPYDGALRITEFKEMVQTLHENDLRVIMDVVYNHTGASADSHLNNIVPNYYYRLNGDTFSNGSGCGNETASERAMVRKMIVDSVVYWATEYHIDGFRFDLMGVHDLETMQAVRDALDAIDPTIIVYGEGWTGGATQLSDDKSCLKANTYQLDGVGAFSDDLRDGIKGHVFNAEEPGFVNGGPGLEESVKFGVVGATEHPEINYSLVNYSKAAWASNPTQSINYAEAHDNLTLWDKLEVTNPETSVEDRMLMDKMSAAIVMTSQGVPFLHAGMEFLRSKDGDHNSYQSPDSINQINWDLKTEHEDIFNYYSGLIELRKQHPAFRMTTNADVVDHIYFYGSEPVDDKRMLEQDGVIGYLITGNANGDSAGTIGVYFNATAEPVELSIPKGDWTVVVNKDQVNLAGIETISGKKITVQPLESLVVLNDEAVTLDRMRVDGVLSENNSTDVLPIALGIGGVLVVGGAGAVVFKKRKTTEKANK